MTIYSIFELSGAISFLSIGLFVLLTNKKSATNFFFFLFCLMCFFWQIGYTICYSTQSSFLAQKFATISCTAVAMTAPLLYYFTVSYIGKRSEEKWAHLAFILIVIQIPFFMFTNLFLMVMHGDGKLYCYSGGFSNDIAKEYGWDTSEKK